MRVTNAVELLATAQRHLPLAEAQHVVRSLNIAVGALSRYPQWHALRTVGSLWTNEEQMSYALSYALPQYMAGGATVPEATRWAADSLLKAMTEEAGLIRQRQPNGTRLWLKPDPAWLDQITEERPDAIFIDPDDIDRAEREVVQEAKVAKLHAVFELAATGIKEIPMEAEGITMLDLMHMVGDHGSRSVAHRLGLDRTTLENRWRTFQRRVAKIMEVTNE